MNYSAFQVALTIYYAAMKTLELINEIIATYQRHGWNLKRVLLRPATRAEFNHQARELLKEARFVDAEFDALDRKSVV